MLRHTARRLPIICVRGNTYSKTLEYLDPPSAPRSGQVHFLYGCFGSFSQQAEAGLPFLTRIVAGALKPSGCINLLLCHGSIWKNPVIGLPYFTGLLILNFLPQQQGNEFAAGDTAPLRLWIWSITAIINGLKIEPNG
jgi:hypothetical protein